MIFRFERLVKKGLVDPRAEAFRSGLVSRGISQAREWTLRSMDVLWVSVDLGGLSGERSVLDRALAECLLDEVLHEDTLEPNYSGFIFQKRLLRGMTDNRARTLREALSLLVPALGDSSAAEAALEIRTGEAILMEGLGDEPARGRLAQESWGQALAPWWQNPVIHEFEAAWVLDSSQWRKAEASSGVFGLRQAEPGPEVVQRFELTHWTDEQLLSLSQQRLLALSLEEMRAIQAYFRKQGRPATDVELEVLAQTWSEHCRHKIFGARIAYQSDDPKDLAPEIPLVVDGVFRQTIRATTTTHAKPWLLSVFSDNAGIVAMSDEDALCLKVETHNSPSALDPFGGAITGIVGVNRDILGCGLGAKPIANLDVFCVAPPGSDNPLPERILDPAVLLEGIRAGVEAGGNQSGIPTVNGSVTFHASYLAKPLVYCGTLGWSPRYVGGRPCEEKRVLPGDQIVMLGGRIGRDGIHGATFSSLALTEDVPGSVVQLGDPITQKRMTDFLLEARDRGLYRALTDNGAGGLSSSVGEMASLSGGARMDISRAPVKMPGLLPFERVISESQERMTLAVPLENWAEFLALARLREVEATAIGEFTDHGKFEILYRSERVAELDLDFLHEGLPRLELQARWRPPVPVVAGGQELRDWSAESFKEGLCRLLAHPNIASKESIIRQYDHEVQGRSVVKPLATPEFQARNPRSSPNDAAVIAVDPGKKALAAVLAHGLSPLLGTVDPYLMGQMAVDEAIRNALAVGAEFSSSSPEALFALVDNFCWPDPTDSSEFAAALVRAAYGMKRACDEFRIPLISGKDSMKNDLRAEKNGQKMRLSILPTLLMTALGRIQDLSLARTADWKTVGDVIFLLGPQESVGFAGSIAGELGLVHGEEMNSRPRPDYEVARRLYDFLGSSRSGLIRSAHDCAEGGLGVALVESCFARGLGVHWEKPVLPSRLEFWGEGFHRLLVSCAAQDEGRLREELARAGVPALKVGVVTREPELVIGANRFSLERFWRVWSSGKVSS